jgi:hypothetical protein
MFSQVSFADLAVHALQRLPWVGRRLLFAGSYLAVSPRNNVPALSEDRSRTSVALDVLLDKMTRRLKWTADSMRHAPAYERKVRLSKLQPITWPI